MRKFLFRLMSSAIVLAAVVFHSGWAQQQPVTPADSIATDHGIRWILVEGGETGDFYIAQTEVTFDQYDKFCDATGYQKPKDDFGRGRQPVIHVSLTDAQAFCAWLSKETGSVVRLPKAKEFQFASEGGKKSEGYVFSGSSDPKDVAWFEDNADEDEYSKDVDLPDIRAHIVATKQPNELGIYDMSGNVWEWTDAPEGVAMGGSYASVPQDCFPYGDTTELGANYRSSIIGFRVVKQK